MLSILIPIYNYDVRNLTCALLINARKLDVPFEIILADDASDEQFRAQYGELTDNKEVTLIQNETNMGRARIRNMLADKAQYDYLLFLDCDAGWKDQVYFQKYRQKIDEIQHFPCSKGFAINGGLAYRSEAPDDQHLLRWHYGKQREEKKATERELHPYHGFTPFNLLITKSVFNTCRFDERFTTYGNEDTLFGAAMQEQNIPIYHIDNPLYHDGLDTDEVYMDKIDSAVKNLAENPQTAKLSDSKLFNTYLRIKKLRLVWAVKLFYHLFQKHIKKQIYDRYSMLALDLYKLGTLCEQM